MTLIQTGKLERFPVIAMGREFWDSVGDFIRGTLLKEGTVSPADLDLIDRAETPDEAVRIVREKCV
jgi:predicted Rossmann-fold nucleotide-binding protein